MRFYLRNDYADRPGIWYLCWTDESGRGRRASARTRDHATAQKALARLILEHDVPRHIRPESVTLEAVMLRYWHHHGRSRFSKDPIRYALAKVTDKLPRLPVAEFDQARQTRFMAELAADGLKASSIARYMGVIAAALNRAKVHGELSAAPAVLEPEAIESAGVEPFSIDELCAVLAAARTENERLMVLIWTATCCRPGAVLDLTWDRVDSATHTIDFRVPGRRLTKKRRTTTPMAPTLEAYLEARRSVGFVVGWKTKKRVARLAGFKVPFRRLLERAGIEGSAYRIRKAVATYLRAQGVPEADVLGMLGHRFGTSETERYAKAGLMPAARDAIEKLFREIAPTWLPVASNWQAPRSNLLIAQGGSGGLVTSQVGVNDDSYRP